MWEGPTELSAGPWNAPLVELKVLEHAVDVGTRYPPYLFRFQNVEIMPLASSST